MSITTERRRLQCVCGAPAVAATAKRGPLPKRCANCNTFLQRVHRIARTWSAPKTDTLDKQLLERKRARGREAARRHREKLRRERSSMPQVSCACGCGTLIPEINWAGQPARFAHGHNDVHAFKQAQFRKGQNIGPLNANWRGGRRSHHSGYVQLLVGNDHPMAKRGYVLAHRLVMSEAIGRPLRSDEQVHHINGDRGDNRLENLQLRQGNHGPGVSHRCCECGSHNVEPVQLLDAESGQTLLVLEGDS